MLAALFVFTSGLAHFGLMLVLHERLGSLRFSRV